MAFRVVKNRYPKEFFPNGRIVFNLDLGQKIQRGFIILQGTVTLTGAAGTAIGAGGPVNLISRVILRANAATPNYPSDEIVDASPRSLLWYAAQQGSGKYIAEQSGSTLGNGAAGTYNIYLAIPILFSDPVLRNRDFTTALNADAYASLQLELYLADITACISGYAANAATYNLMVSWEDERIALTGDTNVLFQEDHEFLIAATAQRQQDLMLPRNGRFLSMQHLGQQGADATLANGLLNRVRMTGDTIDFELWEQDIQQDMLTDAWVDPSQNIAGVHFIDFTDGVLSNSLDAASLALELDLTNVSGANADNLLIYTRRFVAPQTSN